MSAVYEGSALGTPKPSLQPLDVRVDPSTTSQLGASGAEDPTTKTSRNAPLDDFGVLSWVRKVKRAVWMSDVGGGRRDMEIERGRGVEGGILSTAHWRVPSTRARNPCVVNKHLGLSRRLSERCSAPGPSIEERERGEKTKERPNDGRSACIINRPYTLDFYPSFDTCNFECLASKVRSEPMLYLAGDDSAPTSRKDVSHLRVRGATALESAFEALNGLPYALVNTDESGDTNGERTSSPNGQVSIASLGSTLIAPYAPRDVDAVSIFVLTGINFVGACEGDEGGKGFVSMLERRTSMYEDQSPLSLTDNPTCVPLTLTSGRASTGLRPRNEGRTSLFTGSIGDARCLRLRRRVDALDQRDYGSKSHNAG
ncbi:hypothetical protein NMY22_g10240 [Coprinellus aureogranulatus]|nr:hypothetical protein NMY22_g10240 [Coprinellus aureogranulatus]